MVQLVYFPEEFLQLQQELLNHPTLCSELAGQSDTDLTLQFARRFAVIAAYCKIAMDAWYTEEDLRRIADLCIWRLRAMSRDPLLNEAGEEGKYSAVILGADGKPIVYH